MEKFHRKRLLLFNTLAAAGAAATPCGAAIAFTRQGETRKGKGEEFIPERGEVAGVD